MNPAPSRYARPAVIMRARRCASSRTSAIDHQIDVALPVARLDVGEPVMQVGQRVLAGRQQLELLEPQRQLAAPARDRLARDADDVAELRVADRGEQLLAEAVGARQQLDPAAAILEVEEGGLAHQRGGPSRDPPAGSARPTRHRAPDPPCAARTSAISVRSAKRWGR